MHKPIRTCGTRLPDTKQSKALRVNVEEFWFVPNTIIPTDLQTSADEKISTSSFLDIALALLSLANGQQ
jgi:hypothetical protein